MKFPLVALILIHLTKTIDNANILTLLPQPSKSHHVMFERIVRGLANRGHDVDFVNHFPIKNPPKGYNDLSVRGTLRIFVNNITIDEARFKDHQEELYFILNIQGVDACKIMFETEVFNKLKRSKKKYDLVITEIFTTDCMVGFAHVFKAPIVSLTSSVNLPWGSDRIANPDNPSYIPTYFAGFTPRMTLIQRLWNTLYFVYAKVKHYYCNKLTEEAYKKFFGPDIPSIEESIRNTSLLMVNSHLSINQARPSVPGFIEIGGVHINDPKPLDKHFQEVLKTNSKGIIYLSFGSMIKTETFPVKTLQAMLEAFRELPYKVIWKANKVEFPDGLDIPENIHFEAWMPQMDILCSPNIKLFVSHGGLMGSQEAVYCGVPRLGIPIFADQELNLRQAENMGQAIRVGYDDITKERILNAAKELLDNPKYTESVKKQSEIFKDRPMTPLDTALFWIEYVIRHKGAPQLRTAAMELHWYQYYLLDVAVILATPIILAIAILIKLVKKINKSSKSSKTSPKTKKH